jgi:hypothetical protein
MNTAKRFDGPQGFGLRQPSAALGSSRVLESGRGLPQSKALSRGRNCRGGQKQISIA